jgi:hypothetical protein
VLTSRGSARCSKTKGCAPAQAGGQLDLFPLRSSRNCYATVTTLVMSLTRARNTAVGINNWSSLSSLIGCKT